MKSESEALRRLADAIDAVDKMTLALYLKARAGDDVTRAERLELHAAQHLVQDRREQLRTCGQ